MSRVATLGADLVGGSGKLLLKPHNCAGGSQKWLLHLCIQLPWVPGCMLLTCAANMKASALEILRGQRVSGLGQVEHTWEHVPSMYLHWMYLGAVERMQCRGIL